MDISTEIAINADISKAISSGDSEKLRSGLVELGLTPGQTDSVSSLLLGRYVDKAAGVASESCLRVLLEFGGSPEGYGLRNETSPLVKCVNKGSLTCARLLVEAGAKVYRDSLLSAIRRDKPGLIDFLFSNTDPALFHVNEEFPDAKNGERGTLLHYAISYKSTRSVSALLKSGADPSVNFETREFNGKTSTRSPLQLAVKKSPAITELLLNAGCRVDDPDHNVFIFGLCHDSPRIARQTLSMLLDAGAPHEVRGTGLIHHFVKDGWMDDDSRLSCLTELRDRGFSFDVLDDDKRSPIGAISANTEYLLSFLIDSGSKVNASDFSNLIRLSRALSKEFWRELLTKAEPWQGSSRDIVNLSQKLPMNFLCEIASFAKPPKTKGWIKMPELSELLDDIYLWSSPKELTDTLLSIGYVDWLDSEGLDPLLEFFRTKKTRLAWELIGRGMDPSVKRHGNKSSALEYLHGIGAYDSLEKALASWESLTLQKSAEAPEKQTIRKRI